MTTNRREVLDFTLLLQRIQELFTSIAFWGRLSDTECDQLSNALRTNTVLTALDLYNSGISYFGAELLAIALETNNSLKELNLRVNGTSDLGAAAFGKALQTNKALMVLDLYNNGVSEVGAAALGKALKLNGTLTYLDLSGNKINNIGAESVARALEMNKTLKELYIWSNQIGDPGAASLASALEKNTTLTKLSLRRNKVTDRGLESLAHALKVNSSLHGLDLRENKIRFINGFTALESSLEINLGIVELLLDEKRIDPNHAIWEELRTRRKAWDSLIMKYLMKFGFDSPSSFAIASALERIHKDYALAIISSLSRKQLDEELQTKAVRSLVLAEELFGSLSLVDCLYHEFHH